MISLKKQSIIDCRIQVKKNVDSFLSNVDNTLPEHILLKCDTGIGKSVCVRTELGPWILQRKKSKQKYKVFYAVDTHRLSNESAQDLQNNGVNAVVYRGREAINPDTDKPMCANLEAVKAYQSIGGGDVSRDVCGALTGAHCPFRKNCPYMEQSAAVKKADVVIAAHNLLFKHSGLGDMDDYALIVVDETFYKTGLSKPFKIDVDCMSKELSLHPVQNDFTGHRELHIAISQLQNFINQAGDGYITCQSQLPNLDYKKLSKLEWKRKITPAVKPGMTAGQIKSATNGSGYVNLEISKLSEMWKILGKLKNNNNTNECNDSRLRIERKEKDNGKFDLFLHMNFIDKFDDAILSKPILYMDATPSLDIAKVFIKDLVLAADISAETPHAKITMVRGDFNKTSLLPIKNENENSKKVKENKVKNLREIINGLTGTKLVVTHKEYKFNFEDLPNVSLEHFNNTRGLNAYANIDHIIIIGRTFTPDGVLNAAQAYFGCIIKPENPSDNIVCINGEKLKTKEYKNRYLNEVKKQITDAETIQVVGRGRLVNRTEKNPANVLVFAGVDLPMDISAVIDMKNLLPEAKTGKKREMDSYYKKKINELITEINEINEEIQKKPDEMSISIIIDISSGKFCKSGVDVQIDIFENKSSALAVLATNLTADDFIEFLKVDCYPKVYANKHRNSLLSPAVFDANKITSTGTRRGLENITHLDGIWLDNDDGDLEIDEFVKIFPEFKMYIFNSFSSGEIIDGKKMKKWRCYIPISQYISRRAYDYIIKIIRHRLGENGYYQNTKEAAENNGKVHGFDASKYPASSMFYLPCQSGYGDSFFLEFTGDGREIFNPSQVIANNPIHEPAPQEPARNQTSTVPANTTNTSSKMAALRNHLHQQQIQKIQPLITTHYNNCVAAGPKHGNNALYVFALRLKELDLSATEAQAELTAAARQMRSKSERLKEVPILIKKIW